MKAKHVEQRRFAIDGAEQVRALSHHGAHQEAAVRTAHDGQFRLRSVVVLNQPLRRRDEIVEYILLFLEHASVMPVLAKFTPAAKVGQSKYTAVLNPDRGARHEGGSLGNVKSAIGGHQSGCVAIGPKSFAVNKEHGHSGAVLWSTKPASPRNHPA